MSKEMMKRLNKYEIAMKLKHESNHYLIATVLRLECDVTTFRTRRTWKLLNLEKIKNAKYLTFMSQTSLEEQKIDKYVNEIQLYLQQTIELTMSWFKSSRKIKSYWNNECSDVVAQARRLRRKWSKTHILNDWRAYTKTNDEKKKIIDKTKKLVFKRKVSAVCNNSTSI